MPSRNALLFSRRPDTAKAWDISATQWCDHCLPVCVIGGTDCGYLDRTVGRQAVPVSLSALVHTHTLPAVLICIPMIPTLWLQAAQVRRSKLRRERL